MRRLACSTSLSVESRAEAAPSVVVVLGTRRVAISSGTVHIATLGESSADT